MTHLWNDCSRLLESELTPQQFSAWIKPLKALEFDESTATLTICAPNRLKLDAIRSQFSEQIAGAVSRVMQRPISIVFAIEGGGYAHASALRFQLNGAPAASAGDNPDAARTAPVPPTPVTNEPLERARLNPNL